MPQAKEQRLLTVEAPATPVVIGEESLAFGLNGQEISGNDWLALQQDSPFVISPDDQEYECDAELADLSVLMINSGFTTGRDVNIFNNEDDENEQFLSDTEE